jgi:hypothetical protein
MTFPCCTAEIWKRFRDATVTTVAACVNPWMTKSSTALGHGTDTNIKQMLNPKCLSQDLPPTK